MSADERSNKDGFFKGKKWVPVLLMAVGLAVLVTVVVSAFLTGDSEDEISDPSPSPISQVIDRSNTTFLRVGLISFDSCDGILDYYQQNALKEVDDWGLNGRWYPAGGSSLVSPDVEDSISSQEISSQTTANKPSHSTTNIQVVGVDEADIVKTDGDYIYVISGKGKTLQIIDTRQVDENNTPTTIAQLDIDVYAADMLLSIKPADRVGLSDTLIIVSRSYGSLRLIQVDIDNRQSPQVIADFTIDGDYVGMRLSDNVVRLVAASQPLGFDWQNPSGEGLRAKEVALEANKEIIRQSTLDNWVPAYRDNLQTNPVTSPLIDCTQMLAPRIFSGLNTLSIMTFDASEKLTAGSWQAIGLAAQGQEIYATPDHVYVATTEIVDEAEQSTSDDLIITPQPNRANLETIIHKFGTSSANQPGGATTNRLLARPVYLASGKVDGELLNQFSMDEYQGDLRVAVTIDNFAGDNQENHIKILRPNKGTLDEIGAVTGLGIDERIFSVRFMGPQAYIVTFRQIDPLYALDLSDPTDPKALGELKITGFSSYLHPVGDNLLLGVGQEANQLGVVEGLQISLFDTSDPADPRRVSQLLLNDVLGVGRKEGTWSFSPVENDHRAFLFYQGASFVPYSASWRSFEPEYTVGRRAGVLVVQVKDGVLVADKVLQATFPQPDNNDKTSPPVYLRPIRTVVIGDLIYGITAAGEIIVWQLPTGKLLHLLTNEWQFFLA